MTLDKAIATILGVACGDALGAPTEFMQVPEIMARFGPEGIRDLSETDGRYTDDTQMTEALALGLLDAKADAASEIGSPDHVMPFIAKRFVAWSKSPENNRAPGGSCMHGCRNLAREVHWKKSGRPGSNGCGTAMRASPVGIFYKDHATIEAVSRAQAVSTHASLEAEVAAYAAALSVRMLLDGTEPKQTFMDVYARVHESRHVDLFRCVIPRGQAVIDGDMQPYDGCWPSWTGAEAVASAWFCFLLAKHRGEGYVEAVRYGANTNGDSDSVACITGSFAGAYWGLGGEKGVPRSWIEQVERSDELVRLATRLYEEAV